MISEIQFNSLVTLQKELTTAIDCKHPNCWGVCFIPVSDEYCWYHLPPEQKEMANELMSHWNPWGAWSED